MASWQFEPGHTAAEFSVRHMMVSQVRGHFKDVHGTLHFDPENPAKSSVEAVINAAGIWSGETNRDAHLRSADFLDVEKYPTITYSGNNIVCVGGHDYIVSGILTLHGVSREVLLNVQYLGQWQTPWWEEGVDTGPKTRAGFMATTSINRHDFGVSWNGTLDRGGIVVGDLVDITIDAEAILQEG